MQEVSIESLQQQVRTIWGESREVRVFLWGGGVPPHASDLDRGLQWGLSVSVSPLFVLFLLLCGLLICPLLLSLSCRTAVPLLDGCSTGVGVVGCAIITLSPFPSCPCLLSLPFGICRPVPWPLGYVGPVV